MQKRIVYSLLLSSLALVGFGCEPRKPSFVPAAEQPSFQVPPSAEGGKASTGGQSATVTPMLSTETLARSLPESTGPWKADEPVESKLPIPLPDGTRTEYVSLARDYHLKDEEGKLIHVTIADTRGIPALTAFLESYSPREEKDGHYRKAVTIGNEQGWLTYTQSEEGDVERGSGSIVLLFHERFLIQLDGSAGVSADTLTSLANAFRFDALN